MNAFRSRPPALVNPLLAAAFLLALSSTARALDLRIVEVAAPGINCKFDLDCTMDVVEDHVSHFVLPVSAGDAVLQSRLQPVGEPGTPGAGLHGYEYRINLGRLAGITALPCVHTLSLPFGPVSRLDYDDDGIPDDVYVVTRGGLGSVAPSSAELTGETITFRFSPPVCTGASIGRGESSFFFGLASRLPPRAVEASVTDTLGGVTRLEARAPALPARLPPYLRGDPNLSGAVDLADALFILQYLFAGGRTPACKAAADVGGNGRIEMPDAIHLLGYLFRGTANPAAPFPACAIDPQPSPLGCEKYLPCGDGRGPDPSAKAIEIAIISRSTPFRGQVSITGRVENAGGAFRSSPGQQSLYLYEEIPGVRPVLVADAAFEDLEPGEAVSVSYIRHWDSSWEFPPQYRLTIGYDPDIFIDGNEENDDCHLDNNSLERDGADISDLFN